MVLRQVRVFQAYSHGQVQVLKRIGFEISKTHRSTTSESESKAKATAPATQPLTV